VFWGGGFEVGWSVLSSTDVIKGDFSPIAKGGGEGHHFFTCFLWKGGGGENHEIGSLYSL